MKILLVMILNISISNMAYGAGIKLDQIPEKLKSEADAIVLPSGTSLMIEQYLERNKKTYNYKNENDYSVHFLCEKVKKKSKCRMVEVQAYNTSSER